MYIDVFDVFHRLFCKIVQLEFKYNQRVMDEMKEIFWHVSEKMILELLFGTVRVGQHTISIDRMLGHYPNLI